MGSRERRLIAAAAFAFVATSHAADSRECTAAQLAPVDAWLAQHPWRAGKTTAEVRVAAACKPSPADKDVTIVAAAYDRGTPYDKNLVVALVTTRVVAAFIGAIEEDASLMLGSDSLRIDTARYDLARGVRAFGLDVSSAKAGPHCVDGGSGATRTLFVRDGAALRPVLRGVLLESWHVEDGTTPCAEIDPAAKGVGVIANTATSLAMLPHATHGFADIALVSTVDLHPRDRTRVVLHYDGTTYVGDGFQPWRPGIVPDAAGAH